MKPLTFIPSVLLLLLLLLLYTSLGDALHAEDAFNITCTLDSQCYDINHATCQEVILSDDEAGVLLAQQCACDGDLGFYKVEDSCKMDIAVDDICTDEDSVCVDPNSACVLKPGLSPSSRCLCLDGYKMVKDAGSSVFMCGHILSHWDDEECVPCVENGGSCFDTNGDNLRDGCHCPISLTGENCQTVHAFVTCNEDGFNMKICYEPHPGVDVNNPGFSFYTEGHQHSVECQGRPADETDCPDGGLYVLRLPLGESQRIACGTSREKIGGLLKYDNKLYVDQGGFEMPIVFVTYCSFRMTATTSFSGIDTLSSAIASAGQTALPILDMYVKGALDQTYSPGTALHLGDMLRFELHMDNEGHYAGLRVERCMFSSSPTSGDPNAAVLYFTLESCPAPDQSLVTSDNTWRQMNNEPHHVTTGLIPLIMLGSGRSTFVHCTIKICMSRDLAECSPVTCDGDAPTAPSGFGRRKRSADPNDGEDFIHVVQEISVFEDGEEGNSEFIISSEPSVEDSQKDYVIIERVTFVAICIIVLVVFILLIVACVMLMCKYVCVRGKSGMQTALIPTTVPTVSQQHFFEPRLHNSRI